MAKHYTYTNTKMNKVVFETVQDNYVSIDTVDKMVLEAVGTDPRLNPVLIERAIRMVADDFKIPRKTSPNKKRRNNRKKG